MKIDIAVNFLNQYLSTHIDEYLVNDIEDLKNKNVQTTYPYLLLTFSGIDFFGSLEYGFNEKVGIRFKKFIKEWMKNIKVIYADEAIAEIIYDNLRNGLVHNAVLLHGLGTSTYGFSNQEHLFYHEKKDIILIHPVELANDFINTQKLYRDHLFQKSAEEIINTATNLNEYVKLKKNHLRSAHEAAVKTLKNKGLTHHSFTTTTTSHSSTKSTSSITYTPPPDEIDPSPSVGPEPIEG